MFTLSLFRRWKAVTLDFPGFGCSQFCMRYVVRPVNTSKGVSNGGEVLGLRCDGKIVGKDGTSNVQVDGLVISVDVKQKRSEDNDL